MASDAEIKQRWADRRAELKNAGFKKIDGEWRKIGWAPTANYKSKNKTGGAEALTDLQRKVRAEKRKAFASSGYVKQGKEWVKTVKGFS